MERPSWDRGSGIRDADSIVVGGAGPELKFGAFELRTIAL
jgi:hypothetical protein